MVRMAQAIALQSEILAKDVSSIQSLWVDAHRSQERYQASYSARLNELIESLKRKQPASPSSVQAAVSDPADQKGKQPMKATKDYHKDINEG